LLRIKARPTTLLSVTDAAPAFRGPPAPARRGDGSTRQGDGEVLITGADPVFSTKFKIGETCAAVRCYDLAIKTQRDRYLKECLPGISSAMAGAELVRCQFGNGFSGTFYTLFNLN